MGIIRFPAGSGGCLAEASSNRMVVTVCEVKEEWIAVEYSGMEIPPQRRREGERSGEGEHGRIPTSG